MILPLAPVLLSLHLAALIFWLGPTLGAWMVLRAGQRHWHDHDQRLAWVWRVFLRLMWWEHIAFLVLLATGLGLWWSYGLTLAETPWLMLKVVIVLSVFIPIEIADSYFVHYRLRRIYRRQPTRQDMRWVRRYHFFTRVLIPLFVVLIPLLFYLAVFKPHF